MLPRLQDFSRKMKPIYDLLKGTGGTKVGAKTEGGAKGVGKKVKLGKRQQPHDSKMAVKWTEKHQRILETVVKQLQSPAVMAYPDYTLPFFMHCDASNHGLGAVLYQTQEEWTGSSVMVPGHYPRRRKIIIFTRVNWNSLRSSGP